MARARGERSALAVAFESTEKTAPASGYYFADHMSNTLALSRDLIEDDIVGTRDPGDADLDSPSAAGEVGIPVDVEGTGMWLKALLGAPTTTEDTGVYSHVFESGAWDLPSLALERQIPDVPSYEMFLGARAGRMRVQMQRGGRLNGTVDLIAQGASAPASTTSAGTPTARSLSRFMQSEGVVKVDGTTVGNLVSCGLDYSNNLDPVDTVTADGFIGGLDPMRADLSCDLRIRFDSEALFATARAGTAVALSLEWTKSSAAKLVLAMPRMFLSLPGRPVDGPGGIEAAFQARGCRDTDGSAMLTATLTNEVESY